MSSKDLPRQRCLPQPSSAESGDRTRFGTQGNREFGKCVGQEFLWVSAAKQFVMPKRTEDVAVGAAQLLSNAGACLIGKQQPKRRQLHRYLRLRSCALLVLFPTSTYTRSLRLHLSQVHLHSTKLEYHSRQQRSLSEDKYLIPPLP